MRSSVSAKRAIARYRIITETASNRILVLAFCSARHCAVRTPEPWDQYKFPPEALTQVPASHEGPRASCLVDFSAGLFCLRYVRGRDRARLFRLAGAPGVRFHIGCRTNADYGIVRRRHTRRQHQRVEDDIRGGAEFLRLDSIERQRANVHPLPVRWPANAGVVGRIARVPNEDDQTPAERLPMDLRDELTEQVILVRWGGASRLERLHRFQDPAYGRRLARRI